MYELNSHRGVCPPITCNIRSEFITEPFLDIYKMVNISKHVEFINSIYVRFNFVCNYGSINDLTRINTQGKAT